MKAQGTGPRRREGRPVHHSRRGPGRRPKLKKAHWLIGRAAYLARDSGGPWSGCSCTSIRTARGARVTASNTAGLRAAGIGFGCPSMWQPCRIGFVTRLAAVACRAQPGCSPTAGQGPPPLEASRRLLRHGFFHPPRRRYHCTGWRAASSGSSLSSVVFQRQSLVTQPVRPGCRNGTRPRYPWPDPGMGRVR